MWQGRCNHTMAVYCSFGCGFYKFCTYIYTRIYIYIIYIYIHICSFPPWYQKRLHTLKGKGYQLALSRTALQETNPAVLSVVVKETMKNRDKNGHWIWIEISHRQFWLWRFQTWFFFYFQFDWYIFSDCLNHQYELYDTCLEPLWYSRCSAANPTPRDQTTAYKTLVFPVSDSRNDRSKDRKYP